MSEWRGRDRCELRAAALAEHKRKSGGAAVTLAEFLLARIAEDEAVVEGISSGSGDPDFFWGPDRIRAECEAKRQIVEFCAPGGWSESYWHPIGEPGEDDRGNVLAFLALPYAAHPDYREEWKP